MSVTPIAAAGLSDADIAAAQERYPNGETVTVVKPGVVVDPFSQQSSDSWATATSADYPWCAVATDAGIESLLVGRDLTQVALAVYMPYTGVDVASNYRATVRGITYDVYGEPAVWVSPFDADAPSGTVLALKVSEG